MENPTTLKAALNNMKALRKQRNLSQAKIAEEINISRPLYNMIENGKRPLCVDYINRLADVYKVDPSVFTVLTDRETYAALNSEKILHEEYLRGYKAGVAEGLDSKTHYISDGHFEEICFFLDLNYPLFELLIALGYEIEYYCDEYSLHNQCLKKDFFYDNIESEDNRFLHKKYFDKYSFSIRKLKSTKRVYFSPEDSEFFQKEILDFIRFTIEKYWKTTKNRFDDSVTTDFSVTEDTFNTPLDPSLENLTLEEFIEQMGICIEDGGVNPFLVEKHFHSSQREIDKIVKDTGIDKKE